MPVAAAVPVPFAVPEEQLRGPEDSISTRQLERNPEDPDDEHSETVDALEALATPYEYQPVHLSFSCLGPLSADTQVFRMRNVCGQVIEVRDAAGQLFLKASGQFKPVGYRFEFVDVTQRVAFSVSTLESQGKEVFEFIGPGKTTIASATCKRFRPQTKVRVCAGTAKSDNPVEVECRTAAPRPLVGGSYQVSTPDGVPLGTIRRHHRKGFVTHQNFTVVVGPEVDPYLLIFLAVVCNCVNNERSKVGWALVATGFAAVLI